MFPMGSMGPAAPPTRKGKSYQLILYICLLVHVILSIMIMFVGIFQGFFELISALILWCGTKQMQFCLLMFYMILIIISFVQYIASIGLTVQQGTFVLIFRKDSSMYNPYIMVTTILMAVYDIIAIVICFYAYREFKGMLFD